MFATKRNTKLLSWRWTPLVIATLIAGALVFAACGEDSTPTPAASPSPVATPVPTSTPIPPTTSLIDIDADTTGADLVSAISTDEAECLRTAIGDSAYEAIQDLPLSTSGMGFDTFPLGCLSADNATDLTVAMMSIQAGGLSADSRACIKGVFADLGVPGAAMSMADSMRSFITMQLCLTDEEAQALSGPVPPEDAFPLPSQLRCISTQTDLENLFIVYEAFADLGSSAKPPAPSPDMLAAVAEITAAQEACGIPTITQGDGSGP